MTKTSRPQSRAYWAPAHDMQALGAEPPARFEAELEAEYVRARLINNRTLFRMASLLGLLVTFLRIGELAMTNGGDLVRAHPIVIVFPVVVASMSALLAWFAWHP